MWRMDWRMVLLPDSIVARRALAPIVVLLKTGGRKKLLWSVFKRTSRKVPGMEGLFMTVEIDWVPMTSASSSCLERMEKRV